MKKIVAGLLAFESKLIIRKYKPFIVAVTGSVGKTSTKDAIYDAMKGSGHVRKSEKGFNSELGLPLTIIGAPNAWRSVEGWLMNLWTGLKLIATKKSYPEKLILEIGADHPGDIRKVTRWLRPDITVITRISRTPVHVEFFKSPEDVFEEKAFLATAVKDGGKLVLYGDDEKILTLGDRVKSRNVSVISYGLGEKCDVRATAISAVYEGDAPVGMSLKINGLERTFKGIIGETHAYPILAATAATGEMPLNYDAPRGRMNVLQGMNGSTLIDDSYNSSPDAVLAAINVLKGLRSSAEKVCALGDMLELGKYSAEEHRKIGREVASVAARLITVGQRSKLTAEEAIKAGMQADRVKAFDSSIEAAECLKSIVKPGDIILIKGSQRVRMERIASALLREPEKAAKLLVRQEKEWLAKK